MFTFVRVAEEPSSLTCASRIALRGCAAAAHHRRRARHRDRLRLAAEVVLDSKVEAVLLRSLGRGVMVIPLVAGKVGGREVPEQRLRRRVDPVGRNLVALERLSGSRIDQLGGAGRKIAGAHRVGWHGGVLVEEPGARVAAVLQREGGAVVGVLVDARDLDGAAQLKSRSCGWRSAARHRHVASKLFGRGVQGGAAEGVVGCRLEAVLTHAASAKLRLVVAAAAASCAASSSRPVRRRRPEWDFHHRSRHRRRTARCRRARSRRG